MKKLLLIFLVSMFTFTGNSFAVTIDSQTVDADNSLTAKSVFAWDETPWLHITLGGANGGHFPNITSDWKFGGNTLGEADENGTADQANFWVSPLNWNSIRQTGLWTVDSAFQIIHKSNGNNLGSGTDSTTFTVGEAPTVTPEPVSMALFGLGAGALGLKRLRRKK